MLQISPSLMCANQLDIINYLYVLTKMDIDRFHFDIMDGNFVNNLALNLEVIKRARKFTRLPFEVHLMVQQPSKYFKALIEKEVDIILFHVETNEEIQPNLDYLNSKQVKTGLALHLDTSINSLKQYLPDLDYLLLMNTETGYSGLRFNEKVLTKIRNINQYIVENNYGAKIISDGGISLDHLSLLYKAGVDTIVAGTSCLFNKQGISKNLQEFKQINTYVQTKTPSVTYKSFILREPNKFSIETRPLRELQKNEVLIKVMSCGICGSDLNRIFNKGMYSNNLVPGHEFSGKVIKAEDSNLLNKRVAVYPLIPCGECRYCRDFHKENFCENYNYLGSRCDGGFSELAIVPKDNLIILPDEASYNEAALLEPLAVAYHGLQKLIPLTGRVILVTGLGQIGVLSGMLAVRLGAESVYGIDRNLHKCVIAKKAGFTECVARPSEFPDKIDCIIECSGSSSLLNKSINHINKEGEILLLANHEQDLKLTPETMSTILRGELTIRSSWNSLMYEWTNCLHNMRTKWIDVTPLITHTFPLTEITKAFTKIRDKKIDYLKVIINPNTK